MEDPYGWRFAEIYDAFYAAGRGKDYAAESAALAELIRARRPGARSVLDVACGTGEHLRYLRGRFDVEGLELSEPMRAQAVKKLPGVAVHAGDMRDFALGRTFDVVTCLFSSIGYTRSNDQLHATVRAMADHLDPGGLLVVDPWYYPDGWQGGLLEHTVVVADDRTILRLARSDRRDRTTRVTYHYLVGDSGGITHFADVHEMTLFTPDEYATAIRGAGCEQVEFIEGWRARRARIVAVKK